MQVCLNQATVCVYSIEYACVFLCVDIAQLRPRKFTARSSAQLRASPRKLVESRNYAIKCVTQSFSMRNDVLNFHPGSYVLSTGNLPVVRLAW